MPGRSEIISARRLIGLFTASISLILLTTFARAQGPQFDVGAPPGASAGGSVVGQTLGANGGAVVVGQPLGAANFPDVIQSSAPFSGRPGPQGSHVPASALTTPGVPVRRAGQVQAMIKQNAPPLQVPQYGELELDAEFEDYGTPDGMNLDSAIEMLVRQNLDLQAARLEVPMADADVLTANLRANPDLLRRHPARSVRALLVLAAGWAGADRRQHQLPARRDLQASGSHPFGREAKSVTEAQLQDAIRNQIDNLYTVYEDNVSAGLTVAVQRGLLGGHSEAGDAYRVPLQGRAAQGARPPGGPGERPASRAPGQGVEARQDQGKSCPGTHLELASDGHRADRETRRVRPCGQAAGSSP